MSVEDVIEAIGHDGSQIIYPHHREPECRRGFSIDEIQDVAIKFGYIFGHIQGDPVTISREGDTPFRVYGDKDSEFISNRLLNIIQKTRGIILGHESLDKYHAFAYESLTLYDSTAPKKIDLLESGISISEVLPLCEIKSYLEKS